MISIIFRIITGVIKNVINNNKAEYQVPPNVLYRKSVSILYKIKEIVNTNNIDNLLGIKSYFIILQVYFYLANHNK